MKKREFLIIYQLKDREIEDIFTTLELVSFLIYSIFNKKIETIEVKEISFLEEV